MSCVKLCLNLSKPNQWVVRQKLGKFECNRRNGQTGNIGDRNISGGSRYFGVFVDHGGLKQAIKQDREAMLRWQR